MHLAFKALSAKRQAMFTFPMGYEGTTSTIIGYAPNKENNLVDR